MAWLSLIRAWLLFEYLPAPVKALPFGCLWQPGRAVSDIQKITKPELRAALLRTQFNGFFPEMEALGLLRGQIKKSNFDT